MARFDYYTATTRAANYHDLVALLKSEETGDELRSTKGRNGFDERVQVVDQQGDQVGTVQWGGLHKDRVLLEVSGERTPSVVERLRATYEHRCARVDSCHDFDVPNAFEEIHAVVLDVKKRHRLIGEKRGDWDFPELGRTQYLGAPSSAVRFRLYEKGRQPQLRHLERPDWVRAEVQVRPQKDAKSLYSELTPLGVWGASPFSRELAGRLLEVEVNAAPVSGGRRLPDAERAFRWCCKQYAPMFLALREELGDAQSVGMTIFEEIERARLADLRTQAFYRK